MRLKKITPRHIPVIASVALHGFFLILSFRSWPTNNTQTRLKTTLVNLTQNELPIKSTHTSIPSSKTKPLEGNLQPKAKISQTSNHRQYSDLLPNQFNSGSMPVGLEIETVANTGLESSIADGYGANTIMSARSAPQIEAFTEELVAALNVPEAVFLLRVRGTSNALMTREQSSSDKISNIWKVKVSGADPYARALLLKAIQSIPVNSFGREQLDRSDWKQVNVTFDFKWIKAQGFSKEVPYRFDVSGNRIHISKYLYKFEEEVIKAAQYAKVISSGGVDIFAIGEIIYQEFLKVPESSGPAFDPDVRRLQGSAAFQKSIVTIPIK